MNVSRRGFCIAAGTLAATAGGGGVAFGDGTAVTSQPVSRLAELSFFDGAWLGTGTFFFTASGRPKPIVMDIRNSTGYEGNWVITHTRERRTADNPAPLEATYFWGYDPARDVFVAEWFDSVGGRATQQSSGWDGDRLVFTGTMTSSGNSFTLRDTFTRRGHSRYHHIGEADFGTGWTTVDEEEVRRR